MRSPTAYPAWQERFHTGALITTDRYRQVIEASTDCVKELDAGGKVLSINAGGCRLLGLESPARVLGQDWVSSWPAASRPKANEALGNALRGVSSQFTAMCPTAGGEEKCWLSTVTPLFDESGRMQTALVVDRDVTEQMHVQVSLDAIERSLQTRLTMVSAARTAGMRRESLLQERLDIALLAQAVAEDVSRQSQKNEAIGQLVAGIAHDFNNMLQTATMSLSAVLDRPERLAEDQRRLLGYGMEGVRHASMLAKRLLGFARVHAFRPELVELRALARGVEGFIRQTMGGGIDLVMEKTAGESFTLADPHSVEQALMNLCINARDASEGEGTITIAFGTLVVAEETASSVRASGNYVTLSVGDQGSGMDAATRARLFEPYFTTKEEGKGTGLGLAQVYGLMRQSGGFIDVQSQPGIGSTMTLAFPLADTAVLAEAVT